MLNGSHFRSDRFGDINLTPFCCGDTGERSGFRLEIEIIEVRETRVDPIWNLFVSSVNLDKFLWAGIQNYEIENCE